MDLFGIATSAFILGFSGAMMPGPLLTVTISESTRRGFIAGPLITLGHAILELALVLALAGGLSIFLTSGGVAQAIAVLGGAFLVYMGWGMARDAYTGRVSLPMKQGASAGDTPAEGDAPGPAASRPGALPGSGGLHPVAAGILVSLANPYWSLWWATIGLGFITLSLKSGYAGLASFFTGHILADLAWYGLVAAAIAGGRRFITDHIYRGVLVVCGVFLIGLGVYFLYYGLNAKL
ncbi:leucine export protein LeuE [Pelotomaculum sp. FP]|uniref:LysE family transporter n=1 Tax=Pelotomaculum sp. FP TaxID=261474 RepID=UPI001065EE38|nr:LysE family transporter [Pelotomaculum sp. FP]TEB15808.1 leucine export protein LeuE [Pelotomaculum sp. FP]